MNLLIRLLMMTIGCYGVLPAVQSTSDIKCSFKQEATVFEKWELEVAFLGRLDELNQLVDTQVHDAYDADRDGTFIRLIGEFTQGETMVSVPGFAMRDAPNGAWKWLIRWSPRQAGEWRVTLKLRGSIEGQLIEATQALNQTIQATINDKINGPICAPGPADNFRYMRELRPDGSTNGMWLFGACRAWVAGSKDDKPETNWYSQEWIDREEELFKPMREAGFNLLNQWMAPWEYLIIHHDRAELWQDAKGHWKRHALKEDRQWTSYQCFDQGRSRAFDKLVEQAEGGEADTIYLLLSPLAHQSLQVSEHAWGSNESGWSPQNDGGRQTSERLNGFSGFKHNLGVWDFFKADPQLPLDDWRSQLFDHQANYFRYIIARWSYSRAIGLWVLIDEIDAIGDEVGVMKSKSGWWGQPQCDTWLANMQRLFRGTLRRSDALIYHGDPFKHPLHAATTSYGGQSRAGSNMEWTQSDNQQPDLLGWHWYPFMRSRAAWSYKWNYTIEGIEKYSALLTDKRPRLISEFGAADRFTPDADVSLLYPGIFHFGIWTAIFSGQAGIPMDWDDGKEFGELMWRNRPGHFSKEQYPISHIAELKALRLFLKGQSPDDVLHDSGDLRCLGLDGLSAHALFFKTGICAKGWIFSSSAKGSLRIYGLKEQAYRLTWYDPWTAKKIHEEEVQRFKPDDKGVIHIDPQPVLKRLRDKHPAFPEQSRLPKGHDLAFTLAVVD